MIPTTILEKLIDGLLASSPGLVGVLLVVYVFSRTLIRVLLGVQALLAEERQERKDQALACHATHDRIVERTERTMSNATQAIRECGEAHGRAASLFEQVARKIA